MEVNDKLFKDIKYDLIFPFNNLFKKSEKIVSTHHVSDFT